MRKVLALATLALMAAFVLSATPLNPPPCQAPYVEMTNDVKVTGSFTLTQEAIYDYDTCYDPTTGCPLCTLAGNRGENETHIWSACCKDFTEGWPEKWPQWYGIGCICPKKWLKTSRLHATVEISAVNGVFTLFDHKIIDIYGGITGENDNYYEKIEMTFDGTATGGKLAFTKDYGNSKLHAAVGVSGTDIVSLTDSEEIRIYMTLPTGRDYPGIQFKVSASGQGNFTVGAIWYWQYPDPARYFYHKETASGVFEISKTIKFEDVTPQPGAPAKAPEHPSAPV